MSVNPYERYKKASVETANQGKLVLMLYDGAIRFLNTALVALEQRIIDKTNNNIIRAQDIIWELMGSLDMEAGGDIAKNLFSLYDFMNRQLIEANIRKNPEPIKQVISMLQQLREAWVIVFQKETTSGLSQQPPAPDPNDPSSRGGISFER